MALLIKPDSCQGCPMYGNGMGFVPDNDHPDPEVIILGQNPGENEEKGMRIIGYQDGQPVVEACEPQPFIGASGYLLKNTFLPYLKADRVSFKNVLKCRWQRGRKPTNKLPPYEPDLIKAIEHCTSHYLRCEVPVIAHGEIAFYYLTGQYGLPKGKRLRITEWRGFSPNEKTFVTRHCSTMFADKKQKAIARYDWDRAGRWIKGEWPKYLPDRIVVTAETTEQQIRNWFIRAKYHILYVDTEFVPETQFLTLIGIAYRDDDGTIHGIQLPWADKDIPSSIKGAFVRYFRLAAEVQPMGFHNFQADLPVLKQNWDIPFSHYYELHDSMLAHAIVDSALPHDLGFCASLYSEYNKLKHLQQSDFILYNWGDCLTGLETLEACFRQFKKDPALEKIYLEQSIQVARHLLDTHEHGIKIDQEQVSKAQKEVQHYIDHAKAYIDLYSGGINPDSPRQVVARLYEDEGLPVQRGKNRKVSTDADSLLQLRRWYADRHYLDFNPEHEVWTPEYLDKRIQVGEHPLLAGISAYNFYVDKTQKFLAQLNTDRVHPNTAIHTQVTGRHSTTDPPLAQLPPSLQNFLVPDPDEWWIGGDFKGQEVWILACEADDLPTLEALKNGYDTHTMALCEGFDWDYPSNLIDPKQDRDWLERHKLTESFKKWRDWAKRARLALSYGKEPEYLYLIPGTLQLGIGTNAAYMWGLRYLAHHTALPVYWAKLQAIAEQTGMVKSFMGRRRILYEQGNRLRTVMFNGPMQQGGVDILNVTICRVKGRFPYSRYIYGVHDSFWFGFPKPYTEILDQDIRNTILKPFTINNHQVSLPVDWKYRK